MDIIETQQVDVITPALKKVIEKNIDQYLSMSHNKPLIDLYKLVIEEIEVPLYKAVLKHCRYNQSRAAILLGISRVTFRKKLKRCFDE